MEALPVCVVEDSPPIRKLMEVLLTRAGFSVVSFSGVADAVAWLQQHRPAAVLCDLVLPDGNGADVLRVVRPCPRESAFQSSLLQDWPRKATGNTTSEQALTHTSSSR